MATETAAPAGPDLPDRRVTEHEARFSPGLRMLARGSGSWKARSAWSS
jgi:hypothetical protein